MAVTMNAKGTSNPSFKIGNAADGALQTGYIDFNQTATIPDAVGRMKWNSGDGTLDIGMAGGQTTLQVGQELLVRVYNGTGASLTDGQVVYVTGSQGQRPTVALADADLEAASSSTIGVVTETIANASEGFVTLAGLVRNLNTSAWTQGTQLYLSSTAGALTSTKPTAPVNAVRVGWVVRSHATAGSILVQVQNGYELYELHDVLISSPATGQYLSYDSLAGVWRNTGLNGTLVLSPTGSINSSQSLDTIGAYLKPDMGTAGFEVTAKGFVIENVIPSGLDPLNEPFSGLIVKDSNQLTYAPSQITSNALMVGGEAFEDMSGATVSAQLKIAMTDPVDDWSGSGFNFTSGGAVFDTLFGDAGVGEIPVKSYRFKGLTHDVLIKDGVSTTGSSYFNSVTLGDANSGGGLFTYNAKSSGAVTATSSIQPSAFSYGANPGTQHTLKLHSKVSTLQGYLNFGAGISTGPTVVTPSFIDSTSTNLELRRVGTTKLTVNVSGISVTGSITASSDVTLSTASTGVILTSPNGTKYKLTVDDTGALTTTAV